MNKQIEIVPFNYGELELPRQALEDCHHQGACDADVEHWQPLIDWRSQSMSAADIRNELREYGAWDDEELNNEIENQKRILWIAAGDWQEREAHA